MQSTFINLSVGRRYVIFPYVTIPNVTFPKLVKIPNINKNPAIPPKLGEGKGTKLGEGCQKVRLSQDRMPILGEGERD
jgi:hypothetical protein